MSIAPRGIPAATWAVVLDCTARLRANAAQDAPLTTGADPFATCRALGIAPCEQSEAARFGMHGNIGNRYAPRRSRT